MDGYKERQITTVWGTLIVWLGVRNPTKKPRRSGSNDLDYFLAMQPDFRMMALQASLNCMSVGTNGSDLPDSTVRQRTALGCQSGGQDHSFFTTILSSFPVGVKVRVCWMLSVMIKTLTLALRETTPGRTSVKGAS